ncbi:MAG: DNA-binding domain-containing protein [Polyangiales bacterium]
MPDAGGSPERWRLYRRLVRTRIRGLLVAAFPRTQKVVGDNVFVQWVDAYLHAGGPSTPYFYELATEFADRVLGTDDALRNPEWAANLLRLERAQWFARHAPADEQPTAAFNFESAPLLSRSLTLLRLHYAVQNVADTYAPAATRLCVYRDSEHRSAVWELNDMAADLIERWLTTDESVTESVRALTIDRGLGINEAYIEKLSALIADFLTAASSSARVEHLYDDIRSRITNMPARAHASARFLVRSGVSGKWSFGSLAVIRCRWVCGLRCGVVRIQFIENASARA